MINFKYITDLLNIEMNLKTRLRNYRKATEPFQENDRFVYSGSGYLFHSQEEVDRFTDVDDLYFTDISI